MIVTEPVVRERETGGLVRVGDGEVAFEEDWAREDQGRRASETSGKKDDSLMTASGRGGEGRR